ncbi:MAG: hypothetical protein HYR94_04465 [Chloroflexi bacterium]|nr:hypothetical protein [Chloroflexota bacterium]
MNLSLHFALYDYNGKDISEAITRSMQNKGFDPAETYLTQQTLQNLFNDVFLERDEPLTLRRFLVAPPTDNWRLIYPTG